MLAAAVLAAVLVLIMDKKDGGIADVGYGHLGARYVQAAPRACSPRCSRCGCRRLCARYGRPRSSRDERRRRKDRSRRLRGGGRRPESRTPGRPRSRHVRQPQGEAETARRQSLQPTCYVCPRLLNSEEQLPCQSTRASSPVEHPQPSPPFAEIAPNAPLPRGRPDEIHCGLASSADF